MVNEILKNYDTEFAPQLSELLFQGNDLNV